MRIAFHKISHEQHRLEIRRADGSCEAVLCETRSYLMHDLVHYALEHEAGLDGGFWGLLARGRTLVEMNDRTGAAMAAHAPELMEIERVVGALSTAVSGRSAEEVAAAFDRYASALGTANPSWLTVELIRAVQERMRRLLGHWKATRFGSAMELDFSS